MSINAAAYYYDYKDKQLQSGVIDPTFNLLLRYVNVPKSTVMGGEWLASLESNWPAIQQRAEPESPSISLAPVKAKVTIIARLFHIRMNLASDDRYSTSKTIFVRATRDPEDGSVMLHYLYRNTAKVPKPTDSDSHDSAATLSVEGVGTEIWMEGVYWTNRNWHLGLNTAGKTTLRRA